ncbi:hypothetical protein CP532_0863 [Ophiocordyceps camponoti-leonardi (nom. inval.)]|nr:hypothetical protein CP532_0863 [Ophiocordyceps camponoti-leonardi (nom. inval.)]
MSCPYGQLPPKPYRSRYIQQYFPPGVHKILDHRGFFFGQVDDSTVLKYPSCPLDEDDDISRLKQEHLLLAIIGRHPRVIACKGMTENGLLLELVENGNMSKYISESKQPVPSVQQRITWCREIAEAVEHVHSKRVIHCSIVPNKVLIDKDLHIKLADIEGSFLDEGGKTVVHSRVAEPIRYYCPREDSCTATWKTDLFALGSTIHFVMLGEHVFPDITSFEDMLGGKIQSRFSNGVFPEGSHACETITRKCWQQGYDSATEVLKDIKAIEKLHVAEKDPGLKAASSKCIVPSVL